MRVAGSIVLCPPTVASHFVFDVNSTHFNAHSHSSVPSSDRPARRWGSDPILSVFPPPCGAEGAPFRGTDRPLAAAERHHPRLQLGRGCGTEMR
jgi:hypothetical protein